MKSWEGFYGGAAGVIWILLSGDIIGRWDRDYHAPARQNLLRWAIAFFPAVVTFALLSLMVLPLRRAYTVIETKESIEVVKPYSFHFTNPLSGLTKITKWNPKFTLNAYVAGKTSDGKIVRGKITANFAIIESYDALISLHRDWGPPIIDGEFRYIPRGMRKVLDDAFSRVLRQYTFGTLPDGLTLADAVAQSIVLGDLPVKLRGTLEVYDLTYVAGD